MPSERHRHGHVTRGGQRRVDRQGVAGELGGDLELVRERKGREQLLVCAVIESGRHHGAVVAGLAADLAPVRRGGEHPVDGRARLDRGGRAPARGRARPAAPRASRSARTGGWPRGAAAGCRSSSHARDRRQARPAARAAPAAMGERIADHPHRGREPGAQIVLVRDQDRAVAARRCSCTTSWRAIDGKIGCPADGRRAGDSCRCSPCCARACPVRSCSTRTPISASTTRTATAAAAEELIGGLELIDARALVFPMHEPDGYPPANDMVLAEAEAADGRLFAFCRLDPAHSPLQELRRSLDAGARGIKLHPRAEGFNLDHPDLAGVFALAHERRLPILCHAGRGIPALGRHAIEVCARYPDLSLILAHAGISDLAWIWREAPAHPNLFFDTAWWSASDVQALFALVPPGQILMASDAPYSPPAFGATMALRHGLQVGLAPEVLREVLGGQALRLVEGRAAARPGPSAGCGLAAARSDARARLLVPHELRRPDVPRSRSPGDARARATRVRRRRRCSPRAPSTRASSRCWTRASATREARTGGPRISRRAST